MKIPENPFRQALASMYMENYLGKPKFEVLIKKEVNGDMEDLSLDYYIGMERAISKAITVIQTIDKEKLGAAGWMYSAMIQYISYEIERLSAFKDED